MYKNGCFSVTHSCSVWPNWAIFRHFGNKFSSKGSPNIWQLLGYFEKMHFLSKDNYGYYFVNFWGILGYFLFQHLVTLFLLYLSHCTFLSQHFSLLLVYRCQHNHMQTPPNVPVDTNMLHTYAPPYIPFFSYIPIGRQIGWHLKCLIAQVSISTTHVCTLCDLEYTVFSLNTERTLSLQHKNIIQRLFLCFLISLLLAYLSIMLGWQAF